jgi:hypothetical protein
MSKISEYLEAGRAGKVFDPNQGLWVDPQTKQAFVPTFTDDPRSDIMSRVQTGMERQGQPLDISQGAYLVKDPREMPTAMPERGQQRPAPNPEDPWALAQEHMRSSQFKTEIFQKMFPGRDPRAGFQSTAERDMFLKALESTRNMLVDRFKWQLEYQRKKKAKDRKGGLSGVSQQQLMKMIQQEALRLEELNRDPSTPPEGRIEDPMGQAKQNITQLLEMTGSMTGEVMPVDKGDMRTADFRVGRDEAEPRTAEFRVGRDESEMQLLNEPAQRYGVYGADQKGKELNKLKPAEFQKAVINLDEILKSMHPDKSREEINQMHKEIFMGGIIPEDWYAGDAKEIIRRAQARTAGGVKAGAKEATERYYQGGSPALM